MAYPALVKQDGFQLPSPAHTASPKSAADDDRDDPLFMPPNISFLPDAFRKFPAQTHPHPPPHHPQPADFADELATLIETPHVPSHERSTHSGSPATDAYRHNIFDISAPAQPQPPHDIYHADYAPFTPALSALDSIRYADPPAAFQYRHSPSPPHRSRSRSRAPSVGPTRSARRDRRTNSISSHVSGTSPPPRPHPHAIVIPGRGNAMGGFFVPTGTSAPPDYSLPTPDSLSHSLGLQPHPHSQHPQFPYPAQTPSSPYYPYPSVNRDATPGMSISPTDVDFGAISISAITPHHHPSLPASHVSSKHTPTSTSAVKQLDPESHLSEKRRRRRESHNAVERRRRDNINERISELASLIPGVLFECDGPLVVPGAASSPPTATGPSFSEDLFSIGLLGDSGMHVLPTEDGLPDLPEEGSMLKKDPSEESDGFTPTSPTTVPAPDASAIVSPMNGAAANEQTTIKANKGMILRKSVEYIRYLQQLVSVQASRGRDLEERNRALERELALLRGDVAPSSSSIPSTSSSSPSVVSSGVLSMSSSIISTSSKPSSVEGSAGAMDHPGDDFDMEAVSIGSDVVECLREGGEDCGASERRGRQLGRIRSDRTQVHGLGLTQDGMEMI